MKTNGEISVCAITIFIRLLHLVAFTAEVGLLTNVDYYDWLLQITIRSFQQQTNGVDAEFKQLQMHFK